MTHTPNLFFILFVLLTIGCEAQAPQSSPQAQAPAPLQNPAPPAETQRGIPQDSLADEVLALLKQQYPAHDITRLLYVSLTKQRMYWIENGRTQRAFVISGAKNGAGSLSGSNKTPTGLHLIAEKHGATTPPGGILVSRVFQGRIADILSEPLDVPEDHVTTRVLWLKGLEPGINLGKDAQGRNVDSYSRYIYIHGTPEEGLLGQPASHGCIRMKNREVIELYDMAPAGAYVLIRE